MAQRTSGGWVALHAVALAVAVAVAFGCANEDRDGSPSPQAAVDAFVDAVLSADADGAARLVAAEHRSKTDVAGRLDRWRGLRRDEVQSVLRPDAVGKIVHAELRFPTRPGLDESASVIQDRDGRWFMVLRETRGDTGPPRGLQPP